MPLTKYIRFEKQSIKFIWISLVFALGYWVIESLRSVYLNDHLSFMDAFLYPDTKVFWLRVMVVLVILMFGAYIQSLNLMNRETVLTRKNRLNQIHIILMGIFFSIIYWCLEALRDVIVYNEPSFYHQVFGLSSMQFWMRFLPVCMMMLFSSYAQSVFNRHDEVLKRLKKSNKKLTELDQMKSDFLNTVSHELRTPIAIMKEGVTLSMDERVGKLNEMQYKLLTDTLSNIDRLSRLVTDLLDLSRIEAGKLKMNRKTFDVVQMVRNVYTTYRSQAQKNKISLTWHCETPVIPVYADEDKVIQILNNLLNNAMRFTSAGGSIKILVEDLEDIVKFTVSDTGIGISECDLKRLFSKFEQIERVNVSGYKGTGLGLSICKGLVEKHGGYITVKSELGKGSDFIFSIKKVDFPKVLIVDDEKEIIQVISNTLQKDHLNTLTATDGMSALKLAIENRPSLILLDMHLGKMTGYELIGRLKQDKRTADIPLIIVSGYKVNEKKLESSMQQQIPIVEKPFNIHELKRMVQLNISN